MSRYFTDCKTAEELKKAYREAAGKLHPDNNPDRDTTREFQDMQQEFTAAWESLKDVHQNAAGSFYTKAATGTAAAFMDMINALLRMGVDVEVCGSWIWVSGDTRPVKGALKGMGFRFSGNKQCWYWHEGPFRKRGKHICSMDEIRDMYGSEKYAAEQERRENISA